MLLIPLKIYINYYIVPFMCSWCHKYLETFAHGPCETRGDLSIFLSDFLLQDGSLC